ncbi:MAG: polysaccharide deacetylase family protein [Beijerinckiaceae bacterium]
MAQSWDLRHSSAGVLSILFRFANQLLRLRGHSAGMTLKQKIIGAGLAVGRTPGVARLAPSSVRGLGAILMFHHVRPWADDAYSPNRELEITPEFFGDVIQLLRRLGWIVVSLDEAVQRVKAGKSDRPFAALTFDDGYRDNFAWALPVIEREKAPMTLFVASGFMNRSACLWWLDIEEAIRRAAIIDVSPNGHRIAMECATAAQKERTALRLLDILRQSPQDEVDRIANDLAHLYRFDRRERVDSLCLDAKEVAQIATHPLVSIGAHTRTHPMLATVSLERARGEIVAAKAELETLIGKPVRHFAYPIGDARNAGPREFLLAREAGYASALTIRPGMLFAEHAEHLTALPRLSINGRFQSIRDVEFLLSGLPFAMWNRFRRVNAA